MFKKDLEQPINDYGNSIAEITLKYMKTSLTDKKRNKLYAKAGYKLIDQIIELVKKEVIGKKYKVRHKKDCFICKTNDIGNLLIDEQLERLKG